jgi:hypothetical protein
MIQNTGLSSVFERWEVLNALGCATSGIGIIGIYFSETCQP